MSLLSARSGAAEIVAERCQTPEPDVRRRQAVEYLACAVLWLGAAWVERHGAGLDAGSVALGLLATIPALLTGRVWRLPVRWLLGAAAPAVSVLLVAVAAPGGWDGSVRAAAYGYGGAVFLALAGFAQTPARRLMAALGLCLLVLDQFAQAWLAWWGSGDPNHLMTGSFAWHNQMGAFCAAGLLMSSVLVWLGPERRLRVVMGLISGFAMAGLLATGSRASVFAAAGGLVAAAVLVIRVETLTTTIARTAGLVMGWAAVGLVLRSPLFFSTWTWPWSQLVRRLANSGSMDTSTSDRWHFWSAGLHLGIDHLAVGPGLNTFGDLSRWYSPVGLVRSTDPHNELVRGFAEGGLLGAVPLLVIMAAVVVWAAVLIRRWWAHVEPVHPDPVPLAAMVTTGVLGVHALVDFDWRYPTLVMAFGWCAALVAVPRLRSPQVPGGGRGVTGLVAVLSLAATSALGLMVGERTDTALVRAHSGSPLSAQTVLREAWSPWTPDHRLAVAAVDIALRAGQPAPAWTVDALRRRGQIDLSTAIPLALAEASRGQDPAALARLHGWAVRDADRGGAAVIAYAQVLATHGSAGEAAVIATRLVVHQVGSGVRLPERGSALTAAAPLVQADPAALACVTDLVAALPAGQGASDPGAVVPADCAPFSSAKVVP